jgi:hypothetical protein
MVRELHHLICIRRGLEVLIQVDEVICIQVEATEQGKVVEPERLR